MKKIIIIFLLIFLIPCLVYAKDSNVDYKGSSVINSDTSFDNVTFSSENDSESALIVYDSEVTIDNINVNKTGDSSGDTADFYGINSSVFTYNNGKLSIKNGSITTNGSHANAVFAYSNSVIDISDTTIKTYGNNSGGIMVTGDGTIYASNLVVETFGNSSAAIRSDRGGGSILVNGGSYTTSSFGSPAIYSTADIVVNDAKLVSNVSSGIVIEGDNSVTLNNVTLVDSNTKSNTSKEFTNYKNIFIYQSTSGDASDGTGVFIAKKSNIITDNGSTIFVTNTNADITLEDNVIVNNDESGAFLKISASKWGKEGENGADVSLKMINQSVNGDIIVDKLSTLSLTLSDESEITGSINSDNSAKAVNLTISRDSTLSLTNDTYLTSLNNEDESNSNIILNNYNLYVDGVLVSANNDIDSDNLTLSLEEDNSNFKFFLTLSGTTLLILGGFIIKLKNNNI